LKLTLIETVYKSQVLYTTRFKDFNNKHTLSIKKKMSQPENVPLRSKYKANKDDLMGLVSKCQQRNFSEEVDYLEEIGGIFSQSFFCLTKR